MTKISVIIPTYNAERYIKKSVNSVLNQVGINFDFEIIIVDDCSVDNTTKVIKKLSHDKKIRTFSTKTNSGPGIARNIGVDNANGDYILFLDSDDILTETSLSLLAGAVNNDCVDIVCYDWRYLIENKKQGRYDFSSLKKNKNDLINDFLTLGMDGSVIYTLISKDIIDKYQIKFDKGLHEDIDFIFKIYFLSKRIKVLEQPIYLKNDRKDSIVNTISHQHIVGYFRAFREIYAFLEQNRTEQNRTEQMKYYYIGIIGIVAVKVRDIDKTKTHDKQKIDLYKKLNSEFQKLKGEILRKYQQPNINTKYSMIFNEFMQVIDSGEQIIKKMNTFMRKISDKSWSCYDIHNSIFLAPSEIRTCCKRFFVSGKMKGDVVLLNSNDKNEVFDSYSILRAKKDLYTRINKDFSDECRGCPFLEFKNWGYISSLEIKHISFEYHSICNMKCIYCDEKYYGGKKVEYNIERLINNLLEKGSLKKCETIVWGGGEPTLDKKFGELLNKMYREFPNIKQRVVTNSTVFSNDIFSLLYRDAVSITTSIDAGSKESFFEIRKNKNFFGVFDNLSKYASIRPNNVTLKYIVTDNNNEIKEIKNFVELVKSYNLTKVNFHISFNFKNEKVDLKSAIAMVVLYGLLIRLDVRLVFFDDLLRQRLSDISNLKYNDLKLELERYGYSDVLASEKKIDRVIIWGAGIQTKNIIKTTHFLKNVKIEYIVDDTPSKIGTKFCGYKVLEPNVLTTNDIPVLISAVQGSPQILQRYKSIGLNPDRIIKGLVI